MDEQLRELLVGVAANGLSDLLARLRLNRAGQPAGDVTQEALATAIAELTSVEEIHPTIGGESLRRFLRSPEVGNVIRQLYASKGQPKSRKQIEEEFLALWSIRTESSEVSQDELSRLFRNLLSLCDRSLDMALDAGSLKALEAKATQQHGELSGALASVERTVELLNSGSTVDPAEVEDLAIRYRRQVAAREGSITPPALDGARPVPIDDLYVPARLDVLGGGESPPWSYEFFVGQMFRGVVLGNPGSGKSTLAKKLVTDLARDRLTSQKRQTGLVPFLVILRDYGARKRERACSIIDFIAMTSNSRYQVKTSPGVVEYLLLTNQAFVVFDGLDELIDTSDRAEISGDVASFANLYPATPILVTSRDVGYLEAPLPEKVFPSYRLAGFGSEEVREYARKWFHLADLSHSSPPDEEAETFMRDSEGVTDLRSNALLLGLMCNLYKGAGYIPRNRPDVYEACAEMLFDRWDRLRHIGKPLNIESLMRPAMQYLASWIYGDNKLQSGVTERALIEKAAAYLHDRRFDDIDDARLAAKRFIEHCRGRAWVFTDTGTTKTGERLYQFTHRTFLEFFTAGHLVRTNPAPELLLQTLWPHISVQEWDVVAQLCFQLLEQNFDGAGTEMLGKIAAEPPNLSDGERVNRLDFGVRCLEFLVPNPSVTRDLTRNALALFEEWTKRVGFSREAARSVDTVLSLTQVSIENSVPVQEAFGKSVGGMLKGRPQAPYAAELAVNLAVIGTLSRFRKTGLGRKLMLEITEHYGSDLRALAPAADTGLAADLVAVGSLSCGEFVSYHGLEPLFEPRSYRVFIEMEGPSLAEKAFLTVLRGGEDMDEKRAHSVLKTIGTRLADTAPPWHRMVPKGRRWLFRAASEFGPPSDISLEDLPEEERFAALVLGVLYLDDLPERSADRIVPQLRELASEASSPAWESLLSILLARVEGDQDFAAERLRLLGLPKRQEHHLLAWIEGQRAVTARSGLSSRYR